MNRLFYRRVEDTCRNILWCYRHHVALFPNVRDVILAIDVDILFRRSLLHQEDVIQKDGHVQLLLHVVPYVDTGLADGVLDDTWLLIGPDADHDDVVSILYHFLDLWSQMPCAYGFSSYLTAGHGIVFKLVGTDSLIGNLFAGHCTGSYFLSCHGAIAFQGRKPAVDGRQQPGQRLVVCDALQEGNDFVETLYG